LNNSRRAAVFISLEGVGSYRKEGQKVALLKKKRHENQPGSKGAPLVCATRGSGAPANLQTSISSIILEMNT
jgi:hypothetical protein